jgi:hypothetical protein
MCSEEIEVRLNDLDEKVFIISKINEIISTQIVNLSEIAIIVR